MPVYALSLMQQSSAMARPDAQNKKDTGKLLGYISYGIHGVKGLFLIKKPEQRLAKDVSRAVRKVLL
jgi:hypothetical protein